MTVLEAIQKSADFLAKRRVESPRLQAELLLAHILKVPRMTLYLKFDRSLGPAETDALREVVRRRGMREPLQHITGSTSFWGHEIRVNRHVLVPRPETELLAESGWKYLHSARPGGGCRILDLCTGSGCIAIAMAAQCPSSMVVATDLSQEALDMACQNAVQNGVHERIQFLHGDRFAPLDGMRDKPFDLILSNPPYIATMELATLDPEVRDYDPPMALDGGPDGLDFYRRLAVEAAPFLSVGGKLMVEFGDGQVKALKEIFSGEKWIVQAVQDDYSQRARIMTLNPPPPGSIGVG